MADRLGVILASLISPLQLVFDQFTFFILRMTRIELKVETLSYLKTNPNSNLNLNFLKNNDIKNLSWSYSFFYLFLHIKLYRSDVTQNIFFFSRQKDCRTLLA